MFENHFQVQNFAIQKLWVKLPTSQIYCSPGIYSRIFMLNSIKIFSFGIHLKHITPTVNHEKFNSSNI